ncbi:MAG: aldo/keto reductase [Eubacterium sp.]|jgi:predicted aldo/keto reductase-like oxidoreductase|nr:aldo/keto reductase [Eubacterium sp.]
MKRVRFGKTNLQVSKIAFGGIPIQRVETEEAVKIIRGVIDLGVNFIDTANAYSDSEKKIGLAIRGIQRENIVIASKSTAKDKNTFLKHVDLSLKQLGVDYVDIHQLHNVSTENDYNAVFGENGAWEGLQEAIRAGKVRFPAFSSHNIRLAVRIIREGKFMAVQLPFNYIDNEAALEAIPLAKKLDMGFIAMKPFGGGLLSDANLSLKYLMQFDSIVPDPGIEKLSEMEEIMEIADSGAPLTESEVQKIEKAKAELSGSWCHRCDYCQPCPQKIGISTLLGVESIIKRMPFWRASAFASNAAEAARNCISCRSCVAKCPYNLDIPALLKEKIVLWDKYVSENT